MPVSEEKPATNEGDCNWNGQGSNVPRFSGSSDIPNDFPATRDAKKETGCMGARQRRPSAPSVGLKIAQGWTSVVSAPIPSSKRGGVVGGAADDERKREHFPPLSLGFLPLSAE